MASKLAKAAVTGTHTAGIYADMTVDGPVIGTLVCIIDRAKNLPNRKKVGKQDPYCAARLGKEACKTKTDIRGGQTPRWDQELRFTVHDSLDYHQLKLSVFNDDKKTEIIGETFIQLESVVVPGGGTSDLWHNLQFKGRYAGEIRIELTFYDTRPKEDQPESIQRSDPVGDENQSPGGLNGPRQPKPVKRRPLPSMPTSSETTPVRPRLPNGPQSSPLPHARAPPLQQDLSFPYTAWGPDDVGVHHRNTTQDPLPDQREPTSNFADLQDDRYSSTGPLDDYHPHSNPHPSEHHVPRRNKDELYYPDETQNYRQPSVEECYDHRHLSEPTIPQLAPRPQIQPNQPTLDLPELPPYDPRQRRRPVKPLIGQENQQGSYSSPPGMLPQQRPSPDTLSSHHNSYTTSRPSPQTSPVRQIYGSSPLRHQPFEDESDLRSQADAREVREQPPLPQYNHWRSDLRESPRPDLQEHQPDHVPILRPEPLNFRQPRSSPLQTDSNRSYPRPDPYALPAPPEPQYSTPSDSSYTPYRSAEPEEYHNSTPVLYNGGLPSSLNLGRGYEPNVADDTRSMNGDAVYAQHQQTQYQTPPRSINHTYSTPPVRPLPSAIEHESPIYGSPGYPVRTPQSGPVARSQAVSPDPRVPPRKSISPHPPLSHASTVPFGPDSYESFNPNLQHKSSTNSHNTSPFNTPDHKQASPQPSPVHDPDEPIIGSDGRVIDPSDHLPTSTWAPEPEKKPPRKGPEITFRFRNAPQGTKPMPSGSPRAPRETTPTTVNVRATVRPHSTFMTPTHSYAESDSPTDGSGSATSGRNRLQKKSRASVIVQPTSSPIAPVPSAPPSADRRYEHDGYNGPPDQHYHYSNPTTPQYPLREHPGGYNANGSPASYHGSRGSPLALEGKMVVKPGRVDLWSYGGGVGVESGDSGDGGYGGRHGGNDSGYGPMDLSEEMRRIDIGVGSGGRRAGRGRA